MGNNWRSATPFSVASHLQPGTNVLAVLATNRGSSPNPAGLIAELILNEVGGSQTIIRTDATWKTSTTAPTNWNLNGFDAGSWSNSMVLGSYGISPWGIGVTVQGSPGLPIFRRDFVVGPGLLRAVISICGLGQYELTANGVKVGDSLLGGEWSKYDRTCLYETMDITPYLKDGATNTLGVMLGNGFYNIPAGTGRYDWAEMATGGAVSFGLPKVIAQVRLYYSNGTSELIFTDANWKSTTGPITFSSIYGGEDYDERLFANGWDTPGFNDSNWSTPVLTNGPGGVLRGTSHASPPIKAIQTLTPTATNQLSSTLFNYDMGQNASIIPKLTTHGQAGAVIRITPTELIHADGSPVPETDDPGGAPRYWQYTLAGKGIETWFPKFYYSGCRYLQVQLIPAPGSSQLPVVDALAGVVIQSASAPVGEFSCSFDLFNRIHTLIRWAQRNNMMSVLTDCPHRERLGYLEQYNLHGPSLSYEFDMGRLYSKTMDDMADSQADVGTGMVPFFCPEYWHFNVGGAFRDSPEWGSSVVIIPWQHYLYTGDRTLLRQYYPSMTAYFNYLYKQATNDFLNYKALGDWATIGQTTPVALTADAYYYMNAQILAQTAALLGKSSDAAMYGHLVTRIAEAFNRTYFSTTTGYYANGSQTSQAIPLVLGIVPPAEQARVFSYLVANVSSNGVSCGEIGHPYLLRALTSMGRPDMVFKLHSTSDKPGYGYMLNKGATALTESWDASGNSQDHFMLGHIMEWFYHDLAGIQWDPSAPGYEHIIIKPAFVGNITWVKASYNSVRGMIVSDWTLSHDAATLQVTIPAGSTGRVFLPVSGKAIRNLEVSETGTAIWRGGQVIGTCRGVTFRRLVTTHSLKYLIYDVGSGNYQFAWGEAPQ